MVGGLIGAVLKLRLSWIEENSKSNYTNSQSTILTSDAGVEPTSVRYFSLKL